MDLKNATINLKMVYNIAINSQNHNFDITQQINRIEIDK